MGNLRKISNPSYVFGKYGFSGGELHDAQDVAVGQNVYVTDSIIGALSIYDVNGTFLRRIPKTRFDKDGSSLIAELRNELSGSSISSYSRSVPIFLKRTKSMPGCLSLCEGLWEPLGVTVNEYDAVYLTDRKNSQIYASDQDCLSLKGLLTTSMIKYLKLGRLGGIAVFDGKIFVVDTENCRVLVFQEDGSFIGSYGREGDKNGEYCLPVYICIDRLMKRLIISDTLNSRVQILSLDGRHILTLGWQRGDKGELSEPSGVAVDQHRNIYVADTQLHLIRVYSKDGDFLQSFGDYGRGDGLFRNPRGLSVTPKGKVFVVDNNNCRIQVF